MFATDEKPIERLGAALQTVRQGGAHFVEPHALPAVLPTLAGAVLSPGVPLNGALVRTVQSAHVPVYSEIEVAYRLCRAPIVAVTGTKGKSTTTALVGRLFESAGIGAHVGGNIGNPLIGEVEAVRNGDWVIAEVSSFQLESIRSFRPRIAAILNISPDHLDRYHSMEEYAQAKYRIFANQSREDFFIGNLDDKRLRELTADTRVHARQLWFTLREGDARAAMWVHNEQLMFTPITGDPRPIAVMRVDEIPLSGRHNVQNVMAALLCGLAAGLEPGALREGVRAFSPMAHRMQPIATIGGVEFVNDSKATNPGSAIAALQSYERPVVLIAGGRSKNTDFTQLGRVIDERARALIAIGEAAADLAQHVRRTPVERAGSLPDAVRMAAARASAGSVVLLSPACASFDMFESAEDRGERFAAAVRELAGASAPSHA